MHSAIYGQANEPGFGGWLSLLAQESCHRLSASGQVGSSTEHVFTTNRNEA